MVDYKGGICLCQAKNLTFFRLSNLKSLGKWRKGNRNNFELEKLWKQKC